MLGKRDVTCRNVHFQNCSVNVALSLHGFGSPSECIVDVHVDGCKQ